MATLLVCTVAVFSRFGPTRALLAAPLHLLKSLVRPESAWPRAIPASGVAQRIEVNHHEHSLALVGSTTQLTEAESSSHFSPPPAPSRALAALPVVRFCGVDVHAITETQCIDQIVTRLHAGRGGVVVTPNLDHLRRCLRDREFAAILTEADLVVADGMPLVWASRLQGMPLPERVPGSNLISSLAAAAAANKKSVFLLGGAPGSAEGAATVLRERHPAIQIAGLNCPPFGFEKDQHGWDAVTAALVAANPDIVFVALGSPKQERLIQRLRSHLPRTWWIGVGISFSFLAGDVRRAPRWMQKSGLEWAHRLMQEPARLGKRYLLQGLPFAASLLSNAALKGVARKFLGPPVTEIPPQVGLEGGITNLDILPGDLDKIRIGADVVAQPLSAGNSNFVYQAFLSGIASELLPAAAAPRRHTGPLPDALQHLRAVILLGGSVGPTPFRKALGRAIVDLPLEDGRSILAHWRDHTEALKHLLGKDHLHVRVVVDRFSPAPTSTPASNGVLMQIERDGAAYRGTGGVVSDVAAGYDDDDVLLVANAAQILLAPLPDLAIDLAESRGDVSFISHRDGTPSGLLLMRCATLRSIARAGYVDLKEQALPHIAKSFSVTHVQQPHASGLPIRTLEEYISGLQRLQRMHSGQLELDNPFSESCHPTFVIAEPGSYISPKAHVHDSVILRGGRVEDGATLVRSIVCPLGVVHRNRTAIDQLIKNTRHTLS